MSREAQTGGCFPPLSRQVGGVASVFVARGDGSHKFSRTLEEHEQAVREYQLRRREDYRSSPGPGQ